MAKEQNGMEFIYGVYCRKSSESEDRQVQSIEDQERELSEFAEKAGLKIGLSWSESQSAFHPGRPMFAEMLGALEKGKINALLVWHANRLSRNAVDSGAIIYQMDMGHIDHIRTPSGCFYNTPTDKFMLGIELGTSKKDSDEKGVAVVRGIKSKALKGYPNGVAHIGFLNDKTGERGDRKWIVDPLRFPLAQQALKRFLRGDISAYNLWEYMRNELRLTTPQRKRQGGKPIAMSYIYKFLANPVNAGFFFYQGKRYELNENLPRMITEDEYWQIQTMIGRKGYPRPKKYDPFYNLIMKDADGGAVHPDPKFQIICDCKKKFSCINTEECPRCKTPVSKMKEPKHLSYTYYYSNKERKSRMKGIKGIEEKKIDERLLNYFSENVAMSDELSKWCIDNLHALNDQELKESKAKFLSYEDEEKRIQTKLDRLLDQKISLDLSSDDLERYQTKEQQLKVELEAVRAQKRTTTGDSKQFENTEKKFNLMTEIVDILEKGTKKERLSVLLEFGTNLTLDDGEVSICNPKEVEIFIESLKKAKTLCPAFEPKIISDFIDDNEVFSSVRPTLLPLVDEFRTANWTRIKSDLQFSGILGLFPTVALQN